MTRKYANRYPYNTVRQKAFRDECCGKDRWEITIEYNPDQDDGSPPQLKNTVRRNGLPTQYYKTGETTRNLMILWMLIAALVGGIGYGVSHQGFWLAVILVPDILGALGITYSCYRDSQLPDQVNDEISRAADTVMDKRFTDALTVYNARPGAVPIQMLAQNPSQLSHLSVEQLSAMIANEPVLLGKGYAPGSVPPTPSAPPADVPPPAYAP